MTLRTKLVAMAILVMVVMSGSAAVAREYDLGGATVAVLGWGNSLATFEAGGRYEGRLDEAREMFNCEFESVPIDWMTGTDTMMARLLSGDSAYDMWVASSYHFWKIVGQNAFLPVGDLLGEEYFENLPANAKAKSDFFMFRGKRYSFDTVYNNLEQLNLTWWNISLFERNGLPNLYEIYAAGEWNWDKAYEIALLATKDTDGDGVNDEFGITHYSRRWYSLDGGSVTEDVDGKRVYCLNNEQGIAALEEMIRWKNSGFLAEEEIGYNEAWDATKSGKVAMVMGEPLWRIRELEGSGDKWGFVPLPMGPHATRNMYPANTIDMLLLPANCADPEAMVALINFLWPADEFEDGAYEYIEAVAPDFESYEILCEMAENWRGEHFTTEGIIGYDLIIPRFYEAYNGTKSAAAFLDEIADEAQARLDEALRQ